MPGILAPLLRSWRRRTPPGPRATPRIGRTDDAAGRRVARQLADAIDRAIGLGLWEQAEKLAHTAAPMAAGCPRLAEPLARLRLAQGDVETALRLIDTCPDPPASLRMLRAVCMLFLGERAGAELDLHRWAQRSSAPLDARLLLALLDRHRDPDAAARVLKRNLRHLEDPRSLQALLLLAVQRRRGEQAEQWAQRLRACGDPDLETTDIMLQSLSLPGVNAATEPAAEAVHALAMELIAFEPAIEPIAEAECRRPQPASTRLLQRALEEALPDLAERADALHAMARLALIDGDRAAALRFVERGLEENPMSASLVLMLDELQTPGPPDPANVAFIERRAA